MSLRSLNAGVFATWWITGTTAAGLGSLSGPLPANDFLGFKPLKTVL